MQRLLQMVTMCVAGCWSLILPAAGLSEAAFSLSVGGDEVSLRQGETSLLTQTTECAPHANAMAVETGALRTFVCSVGDVPAETQQSSVTVPADAAQEPRSGPPAALEIRSAVKRSSMPDTRLPIGWQQVYGVDRIKLDESSAPVITWISDQEYITRSEAGWLVIDAASGQSKPWYDKVMLAEKLAGIEGVSPEQAAKMASGEWKYVLPGQRLVVFELENRLIRISLDGAQAAIVAGLPHDAELGKLSPTGTAVAFISRFDLWLADFQSGRVYRLTAGGSAELRNGKADWVYFEEVYNRNWDAFQWSPDGNLIVFQQFNDADVPTFQVIDHTDVLQRIETEHFPLAGQTNPTVRLGVVNVADVALRNQSKEGAAIDSSVPEVRWIETTPTNRSAIAVRSSGSANGVVDVKPVVMRGPDDFLISHFQWSPDSSGVYWYWQDRTQTQLHLMTASIATGVSDLLWQDSTGAWVDNPGDLTFLKDGSFLAFSERSGWKHLYRISADGKNVTPVTSGGWEVRALLAISQDESFAIVSGTRDSNIAENIYRINLNRHGDIVRLTPDDGYHRAKVSTHGAYFVDSWSNLHQPTSAGLRNSRGMLLRQLQQPAAVPVDKYRFGEVLLRDVPMADGSATSAIFVLPPDFDVEKKYPVWLMTYGGPHAPGVRDAFSLRLLEQSLANQGIVVIRFDPRSASGYSAKSAWLAYRQLGVEETRDLESVCDWLSAQAWVDSRRIGMNGHSYGGYFTAYAMTHTNRLCAGIAGAPVTDWKNYDTIYTERFMSTPEDNPEGYKISSVTEAADRLQGRLLILHGLMDDNVHPANSMQLIHRLQNADKAFEMMVYPTARHGIRGSHYQRLLYNFIVDAMGKPEARED